MTELLRGEPAGVPRARMMLQRAHWAASAFASYPADAVSRITEAVAEVAYQNAERYAEWAVRETGMGVIEHKKLKNEVCSRGILETYRNDDYASARIDEERGGARLTDDGADFIHLSLWQSLANTAKRPDDHAMPLFRAALPSDVRILAAGSVWTRAARPKRCFERVPTPSRSGGRPSSTPTGRCVPRIPNGHRGARP